MGVFILDAVMLCEKLLCALDDDLISFLIKRSILNHDHILKSHNLNDLIDEFSWEYEMNFSTLQKFELTSELLY